MKNEPLFVLENVSFSYNEGKKALDGISITIEEEEFIAFLGANGTGKTTLLKILDGLVFPQEGKVIFREKEINEKALKNVDFRFFFRKEVAFLFQNCDVQLFCSTVKEELSFTLLQLGFNEFEIEKRVNESAEMFNLKDLLNLSPHTLSEGEKKRVALASLLPQNPSVFLLDEVTNNLDPKNEKFVKSFLKKLNESRKTIICATHDLEFARSFATKVGVIDQLHSLSAFGETEEILNNKELLIKENLI